MIRPFVVLCCAALMAGCSTTPSAVDWRDPRISLELPAPPNKPRIRYLRSLEGPEDVQRSGSLSRIFSWISGGEIEKDPPLARPYAVAADGAGRVWIADTATRLVHFFDLARHRIDYLSAAGESLFLLPSGVAYDPLSERLYVSDALLRKVFAFTAEGNYLGEIDSPDSFQRPAGLAVDGQGRLYVVDVVAGRLDLFSPEGQHLDSLTKGGGGEEAFNRPLSVSVDREGRIYVCDSLNFHVDVFDADRSYFMSIGEVGDMPGAFARPRGVAVDPDGHLYVSDAAFDNVQVFDRDGALRYFFGTAGGFPGAFSMPSGLFIDNAGRLYVADSVNRRVQIYQYLGSQ